MKILFFGCLLAVCAAQGGGLQVMWDDSIVDVAKTTASLRLHEPQYAGTVLTHDQPWEGKAGCEFHTIVHDADEKGVLYRMYYLAWSMLDEEFRGAAPWRFICYAESRDGIAWERPSLGLVDFEGSTANNILLGNDMFDGKWRGGMFVFKDANPDCPKDELYKGISGGNKELSCFVSADGVRFRYGWKLLEHGPTRAIMFDTLNTAHWSEEGRCYNLYIRGYVEDPPRAPFVDREIRQVLHLTSKDFRNWSTPADLDYVSSEGQVENYPMYVNGVFPYPYDPKVLVGFPVRYSERGVWDENFDSLPDAAARRERMVKRPRYGLAVTDGLFMTSRDGHRFFRHDEAFFRPGPERSHGWVYGTGYAAVGVIQTKSARGGDDELSIYVPHGHWFDDRPVALERYTIRRDGFASRHATYRQQSVFTKELTIGGNEIHVNFSTSARGMIRVIVRAGNSLEPIHSDWLFGDSVDRKVKFLNRPIGDYTGKTVTLEFQMSDADLYSFWFQD